MKMLSIPEQYFVNALEKVLPLKVSKVEVTVGCSISEPFGEKFVAALEFQGYYEGILALSLKEDRIDDVASFVLQSFPVDIPVEKEAIFAEIINIYAGSLITEMQVKDRAITIAPPGDASECLPKSGEMQVIKILTENHFMFKFCIYEKGLSDD